MALSQVNFQAPSKLPGNQATLLLLLLPLMAVVTVIGGFSLQLLLDTKRESWIASTRFGEVLGSALSRAPFLPAFVLNASLIGGIFIAGKLVEHRMAVRAEAAAAKSKKKRK